jgi:hypothetical protein
LFHLILSWFWCLRDFFHFSEGDKMRSEHRYVIRILLKRSVGFEISCLTGQPCRCVRVQSLRLSGPIRKRTDLLTSFRQREWFSNGDNPAQIVNQDSQKWKYDSRRLISGPALECHSQFAAQDG